MAQKIVTCCYCGAHTALVLRGKERHELSCASCGAPLHNLKMLPVKSAKKATSHLAPTKGVASRKQKSLKKPKKKKSWLSGALSEAFDVIEDIFD